MDRQESHLLNKNPRNLGLPEIRITPQEMVRHIRKTYSFLQEIALWREIALCQETRRYIPQEKHLGLAETLLGTHHPLQKMLLVETHHHYPGMYLYMLEMDHYHPGNHIFQGRSRAKSCQWRQELPDYLCHHRVIVRRPQGMVLHYHLIIDRLQMHLVLLQLSPLKVTASRLHRPVIQLLIHETRLLHSRGMAIGQRHPVTSRL